jgi:hypothetical protein
MLLLMKIKIENRNGLLYVHVVLFKCPSSGDPMAATCVSENKSLEEVDSHAFKVRCNCGWSGKLLGVKRLKNWVEEWGGDLLLGASRCI